MSAGNGVFRLPPTVSRPALLEGGSDARFRVLVADLVAIAEEMQAARAAFGRRIGLSGAAYSVLMTVAERHAAGGIGVGEIARRLHVSGAFVTTEAGKLVRAGLLEKRPNPADGRGVLLTLAAEGRKRVAAVAPLVRATNDALFGVLDAEEVRALARIAARIAGRAEAVGKAAA
jgi:MarR family transcriptional regulator, organic hydroperoxide resistance regulator